MKGFNFKKFYIKFSDGTDEIIYCSSAWSEKHARGEAEEAEKFIEDFKREYDKASPGMKEALAAGPMIETEDQAHATLAILKMGNLLRSMKNADNN